jgi:WD40 repeat protein
MAKTEVEKIATLTGHRDCVYSLTGGKEPWELFSSGGDGMVVKWDLRHPETGELIAKTTNSVYALLYLSGLEQLIVAENFEGIHKIDLNGKKEIGSSKISESSFFDLKFHHGKIYAGAGDGVITVLNHEDLVTAARLRYSDKSVRSIAINPGAGHLAAGYSDYCLRIFDLENYNLLFTIPAHQNSIFTVVYSPDGEFLLTGSRDAHLKIWEVGNNYHLKQSVVAHMYAINHIEYSPDGSYFATCSMDKSVKIWSAKDFQLLKVIDKARHAGHGTSVNKLFWSSYMDQLVSCSDDRTISVWNVKIDI